MASFLPFTQHEREFVYSVALRYMKDPERAEEVAQEALLAAYSHRHQFRGEAKATTWLYRVTVTTALMQLRKRRERTEELDSTVPALASSPEEEAAVHEAVHLLGDELSRMGKRYGEIFQMHFVEGYSDHEIADRLHMNVATVRTRAHRARVRLQKALVA